MPYCEHSIPDFKRPSTCKREQTLSALLRLGFEPNREVSSRYIAFGTRDGARIFVGRSGALRVGSNVTSSLSITSGTLHTILAGIGAHPNRAYDAVLDRYVPTVPSARREALTRLHRLGVRGGDPRVAEDIEQTLKDHALREAEAAG